MVKLSRPYQDEAVKASYVSRYDGQGNKLCVMHGCPNALTGRQERWCSKECVNEALATYDWSVCRHRILRRDKFICQICGERGGCEVDHILPICEGGKLCDPDNLRTLCTDCHKKVTAQLATRRAAKRKTERLSLQAALTI